MASADAPAKARRVSSRARNDAVLLGAVDVARDAARDVASSPDDVGEHLGTTTEADRLVSHHFAATMRGYQGWHWTVTIARVPRGRVATVCEVELLPGDEAILAPAWVPWSERLQPGDVRPGDTLPFRADDPRLEPGWTPSGDEELDVVAIDELALARQRVLSPQGRDEAAERWYRGSRGPTSPGAVAAASECMTCGFIVPLQGPLGQLFGVCANAWSPDDGKVVSLDHGCGAHSETDVEHRPTEWPDPAPLIDESTIEKVTLAPVAADGPAEAPASSEPAEPAAQPTAEPAAQPTAEPAVEQPDEPAGDQAR